jgi:hypothetical protein
VEGKINVIVFLCTVMSELFDVLQMGVRL